MEKLRITVKQEDIEKGCIGNEHMCPIARAVRRVVRKRVAVTEEELSVGRYGHGMRIYSIPKKASDFVYAFDFGKPVKPFKFVATQITD